MSKIVKVLRPVKYSGDDSYVIVSVQLDDGSEASVYVGGAVDLWFDEAHNKTKAFVLRKPKL